MPSVTDAKFTALRAQGFTGAVSDMTLQWLQANGATSPSVVDAWREMLTLLGFGPERSDAWRDYLLSIAPPSIDRHRNDLALWFWGDTGGILPFDGGFDDGFDGGFG